MCNDFFLAASSPAFSFAYTLYAAFTGNVVANRATHAANRIRDLAGLDDSKSRAANRIISDYGNNVSMVTGLIATAFSYLSGLTSIKWIFKADQIFIFISVATPVVTLAFCVMAMASIGFDNLFSFKVISPFRFLTKRATLPFTYGTAINMLAVICNVVLIIVLAATLGIGECRTVESEGRAPAGSTAISPSSRLR